MRKIRTADNSPSTHFGYAMDKHWYAVYVRPSHEAQVAKRFCTREIENFLPQYQVQHKWKNRCTKKLDLPLFPGYLFAHISTAERVRVLEVPSVLCLVGTAHRPYLCLILKSMPCVPVSQLVTPCHIRLESGPTRPHSKWRFGRHGRRRTPWQEHRASRDQLRADHAKRSG